MATCARSHDNIHVHVYMYRCNNYAAMTSLQVCRCRYLSTIYNVDKYNLGAALYFHMCVSSLSLWCLSFVLAALAVQSSL